MDDFEIETEEKQLIFQFAPISVYYPSESHARQPRFTSALLYSVYVSCTIINTAPKHSSYFEKNINIYFGEIFMPGFSDFFLEIWIIDRTNSLLLETGMAL